MRVKRAVGVGHRHHRLEAAEVAVGAPVLRQLDAGAFELAGEAFELGFEALQQGEGVGGGPGEAGDHAAVAADAADLAGIALDDGLAERDLAVAGHRDAAVPADAEDGGAVPADEVGAGHWSVHLHDDAK